MNGVFLAKVLRVVRAIQAIRLAWHGPFTGPRGGKFWKNDSGRKAYGAKPTSKGEGVDHAHALISKGVSSPEEQQRLHEHLSGLHMDDLRKLAAAHGIKGRGKIAVADRLIGGLHAKAATNPVPTGDSTEGFPPATKVRGEFVPPKEVAASLFAKTKALSQTEKDDLRIYTGASYGPINASFKDGKPNKVALDVQAAVKKANGLPKPTLVYRGLVIPKEDRAKVLAGFQNQIDSGGLYEHKGMVSTSVDPAVARAWADHPDNGIIFEIKAKNGAYVTPISREPGEQEIIQAHGTKYRPVAIHHSVPMAGPSKYIQKFTVIQMEEV